MKPASYGSVGYCAPAITRTFASIAKDEPRETRVRLLAWWFQSADLRAAADSALERELEASVFESMPCDSCLPEVRK